MIKYKDEISNNTCNKVYLDMYLKPIIFGKSEQLTTASLSGLHYHRYDTIDIL